MDRPAAISRAPDTLTLRLVNQLKRCFRSHQLRYVDVAELMGVSEKSIKRYMGGHGITVPVLEKLCACAGVTPLELIEIATSDERTDPLPTTLVQEDALASDVRLSFTYYLLMIGWSPNQIKTEFSLDPSSMNALLTRLDRLGLITLYPENRAKIRALLRPIEGRSSTMNKQMTTAISDLVHNTEPANPDTTARLGYVRLGPASLARAEKLTLSFIDELRRLSKQDLDLDGKQVRWYAACTFLTEHEPQGLRALRSRRAPLEAPLAKEMVSRSSAKAPDASPKAGKEHGATNVYDKSRH